MTKSFQIFFSLLFLAQVAISVEKPELRQRFERVDSLTFKDPSLAMELAIRCQDDAIVLQDDTLIIRSFTKLHQLSTHQGDYEIARGFLDDAINYALEKTMMELIPGLFVRKAEVFQREARYDSSMSWCEKSRTMAAEMKNIEIELRAMNNMAHNYYHSGDDASALEYYIQVSNLARRNKQSELLRESYFNCGNVYLSQGEYKMARKYYQDAIRSNVTIGDKAEGFINIGLTYKKEKKYDDAIVFYQKALAIQDSLRDIEMMAKVRGNIATVYSFQKRFKEAEQNYLEAYELYSSQNNQLGIFKTAFNLGNLYNKLNNPQKALEYLIVAKGIIDKSSNLNFRARVDEEIAESYYKKGNYKVAYEYYETYNNLKDSIAEMSRTEAIAEAQAKFDSERKQQEIELLTKDKQLIEAQSKRQKLFAGAAAIGLILVLAVAFLLFRGYKSKQKANQALANINAELEKLSIVASETDNAIIIADASGQIEWINDGFTRLFGYDLKEVKAIYNNSIDRDREKGEIIQLLKEKKGDSKALMFESSQMKKNGDVVHTLSTITPIYSEKKNKLKKIVVIDSNITLQKEIEKDLATKNKDITDSINYASRIQKNILPDLNKVHECFPDSFILYKPKDIVSGDFYWFFETKDYALVAAVDCTGHGVPGAMMSMIGSNILNQLMVSNILSSPPQLLTWLHEEVRKALGQDQEGSDSRDGMDMGLCRLNKKTLELTFAGANRPMYLLKGGELAQIKLDRRPIGGSQEYSKDPFLKHTEQLSKGDTFYLTSDGYADQFGGENGKKFMIRRFKNLILSVKDESMEKQKGAFDVAFEEWRGEHEQVDDVLVIGVRV